MIANFLFADKFGVKEDFTKQDRQMNMLYGLSLLCLLAVSGVANGGRIKSVSLTQKRSFSPPKGVFDCETLSFYI